MRPSKLKDNNRAFFLVEVAEKVFGADPLNTIRAREEVFARRAISMQLLKEGETFTAIATFFQKDHASIWHIKKHHADWLQYDKGYRLQYEKFITEIAMPTNKLDYTISDIKARVKKFNAQLLELNYTPEMILNFWEEVTTQARQKHSA